MQGNTAAMQRTLSGNSIGRVLKRLLGCRHRYMSYPFTVDDERYRTCLECGARRAFNKHTWTKQHPYYF